VVHKQTKFRNIMRNAALFDLDGTLLPDKGSENIFIEFLTKKGELRFIDMFRTFITAIRNIGSLEGMLFRNKSYLKGKSVERMIHLAEECFIPRINVLVPLMIRDLIQSHKKDGDLLILISGSLYFIVDIFAKTLSFDDRRGAALETKDAKFTGKIDGIHARGEKKIVVLNEFVQKYNLDLANSTAYGNSSLDRFWMAMVGNPVALNPDIKLMEHANKNHWKILRMK
jgi:HAD superfamily hydrolase (TIGR01490 family)